MTYPILEHDPSREALTEPSKIIRPRDVPEHAVICFFREVVDKIVAEHDARELVKNKWEDGPHSIYEIAYQDQRLAFFHPGVGAPVAGSLLEEAIAYGCRKFIACGGCGVLEKGIGVGDLIVVSSALRDEGFSYHYLPPGREVIANEAGVNALVKTLTRRGVPHRLGKTWKTDAPYRETPDIIAKRKEEGCLVVEMEAAALMAVAQFRNVRLIGNRRGAPPVLAAVALPPASSATAGATTPVILRESNIIFGQVLYGGDDLSGELWDNRGWQSRREVRESLFWLSAEACLGL